MEDNFDNVCIREQTDSSWITKVFFRMFLGLFATAAIAFYTYSSGLYLQLLENMSFGILAIIEVGVVLLFSLLFRKLPAMVVTILYFVYAVVNGVTMSIIFAAFEMNTIFLAFLATSAMFAALAVVGYTTKKDMSKFGTICLVALGVGLIFSIVNIFIGNTIIDIVLDWVILAIFCGLTIYDINKIKNAQYEFEDSEKLYVYGAMELYLDFINIFLRILSIMGRRKN